MREEYTRTGNQAAYLAGRTKIEGQLAREQEQIQKSATAASKASAKAKRDQAKAEREAAKAARELERAQRDLEQSLKSITSSFNPAKAAAAMPSNSRRRRYVLGRTFRRVTPATRPIIEAEIERLIALLDAADGDADLENANDLEDDFSLTPLARGYAEGRGPGCEVSDAGGGNVEDEGEEIDEREPVDYNPGLPLYAVDQSKGPVNGDLVERHAALSEQLADLRRSGCYDLARQTKKSLERLEAATPGLIAQRMAANG